MISLVIPVFNNAATIQDLYQRLRTALLGLNDDYEIIFVDDGSCDKSFEILKSLHDKDNRVKVIKLCRNFGQSQATLAGFELARGNFLVTIDADLQYSPEEIPKLLQKLNDGFELVCGWRRKRFDSFLLRKLPSSLANISARIKLGNNSLDIGCFFMALRKTVALRIMGYGSMARFLKPLLIKLAKPSCWIEVRHSPRISGKSQYSVSKLLCMAFDFMINFSPKPKPASKPLFIIESIVT